jgi:hypothetical protein
MGISSKASSWGDCFSLLGWACLFFCDDKLWVWDCQAKIVDVFVVCLLSTPPFEECTSILNYPAWHVVVDLQNLYVLVACVGCRTYLPVQVLVVSASSLGYGSLLLVCRYSSSTRTPNGLCTCTLTYVETSINMS